MSGPVPKLRIRSVCGPPGGPEGVGGPMLLSKLRRPLPEDGPVGGCLSGEGGRGASEAPKRPSLLPGMDCGPPCPPLAAVRPRPRGPDGMSEPAGTGFSRP